MPIGPPMALPPEPLQCIDPALLMPLDGSQPPDIPSVATATR